MGDESDAKIPKYFARLEATLPDKEWAGKKLEYIVKEEAFIVAGIDEKPGQQGVFRIPSEWVSSPHLSVRYDKPADKFFVASFGEKTIVNENEVGNSTSDAPIWTELPMNSRIVLNGIVSINIYKV